MLVHPNCPRCCHNRDVKKHGSIRDKKPRWLCKGCNFKFSERTTLTKPKAIRCLAVALYFFGLTYKQIGNMFDVSHETVRSWVKDSEADEDALEIPKTIPVHITPVSAISDWKRILEETLAALPEEGETKPLFLVTGKSFEQPESIMMNIPPRKQTKT